MIVVKPNVMTDSNMTSSIPEPDGARGEVEWEDRIPATSFGSYLGTYFASSTGGDGNIYCAGDTGTVLKIDGDNKLATSFGSYVGTYYSAATGGDGNVYAIGDTGTVLKIDVTTQIVTSLGSYLGTYNAAATGFDGNIYCAGAAGTVLKIDVAAQLVTSFGSHTGNYLAAATGSDGNVYAIGDSGTVLRIGVANQLVTSFGSYLGSYLSAATGGDGNIYGLGSYGTVLKVNIVEQLATSFGSYIGTYTAAEVGVDGFIHAVGDQGKVLRVDIDELKLSVSGSYLGIYYCAAAGSDGDIYCAGNSGTVLDVKPAYDAGDKVIKVSTNRVYEATTLTVDDPEVGVNLDVPSWVDIGPTNKYAMFDESIITTSSDGSPVIVTHTAGVPITGVAMFGVNDASNVNVTVNSTAYGEVYNRDIPLTDNSGVIDGWSYYFEPITKGDKFILLDLPPYADATITVTIIGGVSIKVGTLIFGPQISVGVTNYNTEIQLLDFSTRERDAFGNFSITRRATADLVKFDVTIQKSKVTYVRRQFQELSQVAAVFVGGDGSIDDPTVVYGYYENFTNNISSPSVTDSTITIQGVV